MITREVAERFMTIFRGLERAYGRYDVMANQKDGAKKAGQARTVRDPVTLDLWLKHLNGEQGIGIIPITDDATVYWGCLDVDIYDLNIEALEERLRKFPFIVCRSKSGGAHLFLFVSEPVSAELMQKKLSEASSALGFGTLEVFPKQTSLKTDRDDVGNWLNMPYFGGDNTTRYCIVNKQALSIDEFLKYVSEKTISPDELEEFKILDAKDGIEAIPDGPPCLQVLCHMGFHEGGRNNGLYNLGVYYKNAYPDDWQKRVEDANRRFMHPPLDAKEVLDTIKSLDKKQYNYTCSKHPIQAHCNKPACVKRKFGIRGGEGAQSDPDLPLIGGLVKFDSTPPVWFLDVESHRIGPLETEDLQNQIRFQRACMEQVNIITPIVKPRKWHSKVSELLQTCQIVEMPEDATPEGQLWQYLEHFCVGRAQCEDWEDLATSTMPYTDVEQKITYFKIKDFLDFLERNRFRELKMHKISVILKQRGATHGGFKIKGKYINLWSIPAFETQEANLKTPDFGNAEF